MILPFFDKYDEIQIYLKYALSEATNFAYVLCNLWIPSVKVWLFRSGCLEAI